MSAVKLSERLKAVADYARTSGVICDVGTDHALLPCYLYGKGARKLIACDINDGPLIAAKETIKTYIGDNDCISVIKSDGLQEIAYADDVIIAGMGGELITRIVSQCGFLSENTRFILQPMTKAELLRKSLYENGFEITEEKTVTDGKLYVVMLVCYKGIKTTVSPAFSYIGKVKDKVYIDKQISVLSKAAENCRNSDKEKSVYLTEIVRKIVEMRDKVES